MKNTQILSTAAFALLLATSCSDGDERAEIATVDTDERLETVTPGVADNSVVAAEVYDDDLSTSTPATYEQTEPMADRATDASNASTWQDDKYAGLMHDEILYRQLDGHVDWNSVPREQWDDADDL